MNRATFFKTLALGLASAPTLAKVAGEEQFPEGSVVFITGINKPETDGPWFNGQEWAIVENGMIWKMDQYPLRFSA